MPENINNKISDLADIILESKSTIVLTGAGISTESGIPDFRSKKTGIYNQFNEDTFSSNIFSSNPTIFYDFAKVWFKKLEKCEPNNTHNVLKWLEDKHLLDYIITQNIDSLHHKAGSKKVLEIHGSLQNAKCLECNYETELSDIKNQIYQENKNVPVCKKCNGIIKPNVVFFGDRLPPIMDKSIEISQKSNLFLVLGSSLLIQPVASLPMLTSGKLAIINLTETPLDQHASIIINESVGDVMQNLKETIIKKLEQKSSNQTY